MQRAPALLLLLSGTACAAQVIVGPDAPDMSIAYDGAVLYFTLTNPPGSNNENGMYAEAFTPVDPTPDPFWRFQGYAIYELTPDDANDSLRFVVQDLERAQALAWSDVADGVLSAWNNFILDGDSCTSGEWSFEDDGAVMEFSSAVSAITGQAWHPDSTYCFVAMAFATTPHFIHPGCGTEQTMLFSRRGPFGALQAYCITPSTVGIAESDGGSVSIGPKPASDVLHVRAPAGNWQATCFDAEGRAVLQQRMAAEDRIDVRALASGVFVLQLRAEGGAVIRERFIVEHDVR